MEQSTLRPEVAQRKTLILMAWLEPGSARDMLSQPFEVTKPP